MATKKLLIIDDDEDTRILVKFALEINHEWEILIASNGAEGITRAKLERPDVILLDLAMPGLDGLTVCEILKFNLFTSSIPIIFFTAMVEPNLLH